MPTFGKALSGLREDRGLTQSELAEAVGLDPTTISKMENDHFRPRRATVLALATALGAGPELLLVASGFQVNISSDSDLVLRSRRRMTPEKPDDLSLDDIFKCLADALKDPGLQEADREYLLDTLKRLTGWVRSKKIQ